MKKFDHRLEKQSSFLSRTLHVIVRWVPRHMRRVILWATVLTACRKSNSVDDQCIAALNDLLKLCQQRNAIRLPITLSRALWQDLAGAVEIIKSNPKTPADSVAYSHSFVKQIPEWLRYSSDSAIERDFNTLVNNRSLVGI